ACSIRASFCRCDQWSNEGWNERYARRRLRISPQWRFQCAEHIRVGARQFETESVRRHRRRTAHQEQTLLLRRRASHGYPIDTGSAEYLTVGRVDYNISDKHSLFGRYLTAVYNQPSDFDPANLLALANAELRFRVHSLVVGDTYLIGNGTVSNFRATAYRTKIPKSSPQYFDANDVGINMFVDVKKFMRFAMTVGGFNMAGTGATPTRYNTTGFRLAEH